MSTVIYQKEDRIVTITLNRPEAHNSFDPTQLAEFYAALVKFRDDPDAWVGIITGAGNKAFCAGADLKDLVSDNIATAQASGGGDFYRNVPPNIMRGMTIMKPLIAAINGVAFGGGLECALGCDLRIAADHAMLGVPEVKWSVIPGLGGTQRLPRMIPRAKAVEMLMFGEPIDAKEAYRIGLVNLVVPAAELMPTAKKWATKISGNGPLALQCIKEILAQTIDKTLEEGLEIEKALGSKLFGTEDALEGPKAFMERRKPNFKGK